ncbi:CYFA0S08e03708g1_1 [Cyberlindnera fabianii]|uniref:CYFA0S08e03708g1_1 n=1 Tax=Cyberlindnera fabianii TaxID=36022 RepID=A0A061B518_CYBFA|nr:CYFA0S08e03708g1_1 [Cyberlindnera fabianii]
MTVLGIGCDVLKISRIASLVTKHGLGSPFLTRFGHRVLHKSELPTYQQLQESKDLDGVVRHLSGSWALKEAVYKTLDDSVQEKFRFNEWARGSTSRGRPTILSEIYQQHHPNEEFLASISHDGGILMATVVRQLKKT